MNPFLAWPPQSSAYVPARLYAKLDELEPLQATTGFEFIFGGLDANWFDSNQASLIGKRGMSRALAIDHMPVFYLESDGGPPTFQAPGLDDVWQGLPAAWDDWFEIELSSTPPNGRLYPNLFGDPLPVRIVSCRRADVSIAGFLQQVHDLDEWQASSNDLVSAHAHIASSSFELFAVYDVGQGSANGICSTSKKPAIYFDFGGGVRGNRSTRPHSTPSFCLCSRPQFILSHWDADHWSSGPLQPASLSLTWTAPLQSVSSPHLSFAGSIISAGGRLLVWAGAKGSNFSIGNATFHRAGGTLRNDSGIWLQILDPNLGDPFVFPADSDYLHLGAHAPTRATGITATHHGANWHSSTPPPSSTSAALRTWSAFSFGPGNSYGHPTHRSVTDHRSAGFLRLDTAIRVGGASGNGTGHIQLDWAGAAVISAPCGVSSCYQNLDFP